MQWHLLKPLLGCACKAIITAAAGHQGECLWPAFADTGFGAIGSVRKGVLGKDLEQMVEQACLLARLSVGGVDRVRPLAESVKGTLETESFERNVVEGSGLLHEASDEVVGDGVHVDLLADHGGRLAAQHVHAKGDLDVAEEKFDGPAPYNHRGHIAFCIKCDPRTLANTKGEYR